MDIKQLELVNKWINQFDLVDRYSAEYFLQSLVYVSFSEFEKEIQDQVEKKVHQLQRKNKNCVAVFPVSRSAQNKFNIKKESKPSNDSSGRIGHVLKNLERKLPGLIEVSPRTISMSNKKVRNIIFVDDFIGTGTRFVKFWRKDVNKSIKSWVSGGFCKVWLISYATHAKGTKKICTNISAFNPKRIISNYRYRSSPLFKNKIFKNLALIYGSKTDKPSASLGYGSIATPIIFQHGCPNNAPAILWAGSKNKSLESRWAPLFSDRSIATSLYQLFEVNVSFQTFPELLWANREKKLALKFCEKYNSEKKAKVYVLILALVKKKYSEEQLLEILSPIGINEATKAIKLLQKHKLIDSYFKLTVFGNDILEKNKKSKNVYKDKDFEYYYPTRFLGSRRDI